MQENLLSKKFTLVALLLVTELGVAQAPQQRGTLTINGHPGKAPVIQIGGKSYVEVEALARLTNGSVSFQANQIALTLPPSVPSTTPQTEPPAKPGFSREFLRAVIEGMTAIREWRTAIVTSIQNHYPVNEDCIGGYRGMADTKLALVSTAVATDSDRNGLPLIRNEFDNMQKLSDKYLAMHKSMTYVAPDLLENDPLDQQILSCARSLASLAVGGQLQDVAACH